MQGNLHGPRWQFHISYIFVVLLSFINGLQLLSKICNTLRECDQERISGKGMEDRIRIVKCPKESFLSYNYLSNSQKVGDTLRVKLVRVNIVESEVGWSQHLPRVE